jgi:uncharacterized protein YycO
LKILFYKARYGKIWDKLIGLWTFGPYSHVEILFSDGVCFSSSPRDGGVRFKNIHILPERWTAIDMPTDQEENIKKWCEKKVGLRYDWWGILGFVLPFVRQERKAWYCSEICITALKKFGIVGCRARISPNSFYIFIKAKTS